MTALPVISLWQPWASLIFAGVKKHETRGFEPPLKYVGGYIGIHATAKFPAAKHISEELHELCLDTFGRSYNYTLPLGAVLGAARLSGALPTGAAPPASLADYIAGDWTPGRFAWPLSDIIKFPAAIPAKGKQGWWKLEIPSVSHPPIPQGDQP
jgi:hypothetical protein